VVLLPQEPKNKKAIPSDLSGWLMIIFHMFSLAARLSSIRIRGFASSSYPDFACTEI
jgi:hypothetical protein